MATFQFNLVSPEKLLFSGDVDQVDVPGSEGYFGVLAGHAPLVSTLRPGILTVYREGGALRIVVTGGFAEVSPAGLTVLADMASLADEFDGSLLAAQISDTETLLTGAKDESRRDKLALRLDELKALQGELAH